MVQDAALAEKYVACVLVKLTTASVILDLQIAENYSSECRTWIVVAFPPTSQQQYWLCGTVVKSSDCRRLCILHNEQYLAKNTPLFIISSMTYRMQ